MFHFWLDLQDASVYVNGMFLSCYIMMTVPTSVPDFELSFVLDEVSALCGELDHLGMPWSLVDVLENLLDALRRPLDFSLYLQVFVVLTDHPKIVS